ncbi:HNH endonuclease [Gordonia phage Float294]|uniref:HNH endonuclease n=1 Tax=Gordonia phage Skysand TaxID=2301559 RepID=A0A385DU33_9CAUD|nr:HNH endonuclease [Gordonia phage Skysand]AXQ62059.1 HNH endonuclease [Gordonia phage Skysand]QRI45265.1 HNH endonuclease [Gordonia phage Ennea]QXN74408.1 HNH endonuclease [Gordonia phage Float294]
MTGRAPKLCSWRDPENMSRKCSRRAEEAPNGDDFRCKEHWRKSFGVKVPTRDRPLTEDEKNFVRERDFHVCRECGEPAHQVDHIVERIDGGGNEPSNLQLLCDACHADKTRNSQEEWRPGIRRGTSSRAQVKRKARAAGLYMQ